jgi:hypothetical protein
MLAGLETGLVLMDSVLPVRDLYRAKTGKPQTTVSRKGAKNAKHAKNAGWAGDVLGPNGLSPSRRELYSV